MDQRDTTCASLVSACLPLLLIDDSFPRSDAVCSQAAVSLLTGLDACTWMTCAKALASGSDTPVTFPLGSLSLSR